MCWLGKRRQCFIESIKYKNESAYLNDTRKTMFVYFYLLIYTYNRYVCRDNHSMRLGWRWYLIVGCIHLSVLHLSQSYSKESRFPRAPLAWQVRSAGRVRRVETQPRTRRIIESPQKCGSFILFFIHFRGILSVEATWWCCRLLACDVPGASWLLTSACVIRGWQISDKRFP